MIISVLNSEPEPWPIFSLNVFCSDNIRQVMTDLVQDTPMPKTPLDGIGKVLDAMKPIGVVIDTIADLHPAAKTAWSLVSIGTKPLRKLMESDEIVRKLYVTMISTYEQAISQEILSKRESLKTVYDALFQHTIECSTFIRGYVNKTSLAERITRAFLSDTAEEFCEGFEDLRKMLLLNIVAEALAVALSTQEDAEEIKMRQTLRELRPPKSLRTKSKCMKNTRVETIKYLLTWITELRGGMLWCSGLAGTGKSSIVGTLHEHFVVHTSVRSAG
ncbi:uncharacterized protein EV420DRAFT_1072271 [Desarmillaria tabescens]|uniref:Uncharacterized protein n=1 Tax=Armillaria tabescens TaxID=1929756 RepID=A0AA39MQE8_ARMTA|nr:uncharacterized protein EV420DRAFT_1072271 [Desarmillaria tabescens]KAK0442802.1 hypothetical protein EV420DRAFT_1072271 [Desarmillaria tabescens]